MFLVFTISIALAVSMVMLVSAMPSNITTDFERIQLTKTRIAIIKQAVDVYRENNSNLKLPCPARLNISTDNITFGKEISPCACTSGIKCAYDENVVIGAVPTATLNLSDEYAFDAWGNKFSYAIDIDTTVNFSNIDNANNNIQIIGSEGDDASDDYGNDLINYATQGIGAIIISHGKDGAGSFNKTDIEKTCKTENQDGENCNNDSIFMISKWNTDKTIFYDDIVDALIYTNCLEPSGYVNAEVQAGNKHHTAERRIDCLDGFTGDSTYIKCDSGVWIGDSPSCI